MIEYDGQPDGDILQVGGAAPQIRVAMYPSMSLLLAGPVHCGFFGIVVYLVLRFRMP